MLTMELVLREKRGRMKIGDFVHHECDAKTERMKLLIIDDLGNGMLLCRYIHHKELDTIPERKFHVSELVGVL